MSSRDISSAKETVLSGKLNPTLGNLFILLVTVQFYILPLISLISGDDANKYAMYTYLYSMISYTLIILGIMVLHSRGINLLSDYFTLGIIVFSCFFRSSLGGSFEIYYQTYMAFLGIILLIFVARNWKSMRTPNALSITIGLIWSVGTVIGLSIVRYALYSFHGSPPVDLFGYIINMSVFQLSFVVVIEEASFRGLLVGLMLMNGWGENKAYLSQGLLFWGIHYLKIVDPTLFFVIIPLFTLSATLLMRKYKTLFLPIIMHLLNNVFAAILIAFL